MTVVAPPGGENEIDTIALDVRIPNIYGLMGLFIIIMTPDVYYLYKISLQNDVSW